MRVRAIAVLSCFLLVALAAGTATAQDRDRDVRFGLKAGFNWSNHRSDPIELDGELGFMGGGFVSFRVSESFEIQPEVLYARLVSTVPGPFRVGPGMLLQDPELETDILDVPVLFKYVVTGNDGIHPNVYAGPFFGFILDNTLDGIDVTDDTEDTDYGVVFGGGVELGRGDVRGLIDVRYLVGLRDVDSTTANEIKAGMLQVMGGVVF